MFIDVNKIRRGDGSCCGYKVVISQDKYDHEYVSDISYELDDYRKIEMYFTRNTVRYLTTICKYIDENANIIKNVAGHIPTVIATNLAYYLNEKNIVVGFDAEED